MVCSALSALHRCWAEQFFEALTELSFRVHFFNLFMASVLRATMLQARVAVMNASGWHYAQGVIRSCWLSWSARTYFVPFTTPELS